MKLLLHIMNSIELFNGPELNVDLKQRLELRAASCELWRELGIWKLKKRECAGGGVWELCPRRADCLYFDFMGALSAPET